MRILLLVLLITGCGSEGPSLPFPDLDAKHDYTTPLGFYVNANKGVAPQPGFEQRIDNVWLSIQACVNQSYTMPKTLIINYTDNLRLDMDAYVQWWGKDKNLVALIEITTFDISEHAEMALTRHEMLHVILALSNASPNDNVNHESHFWGKCRY